MRLEIDLRLGVNENASAYFEKAKKFRRKLSGLAKGMAELKRKAERENAAGAGALVRAAVKKRSRKWFEKFHWFFTGDGFLVLAGRDARSNEVLVSKFMDTRDLYFHADIHGAGHVVLKAAALEGGDSIPSITKDALPSEASKAEAAAFAAVFSSAWREKLPAVDVYSARPEQVTKAAPTGESIGAGAFMVYGKREWYRKTQLKFAIGLSVRDGKAEVLSGPPSTMQKHCDFSVQLGFGQDSKGEAAKKLLKIFSVQLGNVHAITHDDIVAMLPSGGISITR